MQTAAIPLEIDKTSPREIDRDPVVLIGAMQDACSRKAQRMKSWWLSWNICARKLTRGLQIRLCHVQSSMNGRYFSPEHYSVVIAADNLQFRHT